jgi:hypothetical protein
MDVQPEPPFSIALDKKVLPERILSWSAAITEMGRLAEKNPGRLVQVLDGRQEERAGARFVQIRQ